MSHLADHIVKMTDICSDPFPPISLSTHLSFRLPCNFRTPTKAPCAWLQARVALSRVPLKRVKAGRVDDIAGWLQNVSNVAMCGRFHFRPSLNILISRGVALVMVFITKGRMLISSKGSPQTKYTLSDIHEETREPLLIHLHLRC